MVRADLLGPKYCWNSHPKGLCLEQPFGECCRCRIHHHGKGGWRPAEFQVAGHEHGTKAPANSTIIAFERSFVSHPFRHIMSLHLDRDLPSSDKVSTTGYPSFVIGPITDRKFLENGRKYVQSDKGPCTFTQFLVPVYRGLTANGKHAIGASTLEYVLSIAKREQQRIEKLRQFPRLEGILGGPGSYQPTAEGKLAVLRDFRNSPLSWFRRTKLLRCLCYDTRIYNRITFSSTQGALPRSCLSLTGNRSI